MTRAPANLLSKRYFWESSLKPQALVEVPTTEALKLKSLPGVYWETANGFPVIFYLPEVK